jgi:hypothetical protein
LTEGQREKGAKTRTWFSLPPETAHPEPGLRQAQPERGLEYSANKDSAHPELVEGSSAHPEPVEGQIFAAAGLWRQTEEWGLAYTMVMTEACLHVSAEPPSVLSLSKDRMLRSC